MYPEGLAAYGLSYIRPNAAEHAEVDRIIMDELVYGVFTPESITYFQGVIGRMKDEGCDAVVLGCTEIPLVMNPTDRQLSSAYARHPHVNYVCISKDQCKRESLPRLQTIHHGIDLSKYQLRTDKQPYLSFIGRIAPIRVRTWQLRSRNVQGFH